MALRSYPIMLFKINGQDPPASLRLLQIQHFMPSDMMHKAEFDFENHDRRLELSNLRSWLASGNMIEFAYGYIGELSETFKYQIRAYKGDEILTVTAYPYVKGGEQPRDRTFKDSKYSDVAKLMAQEMGLRTEKIQDTLCKESQLRQKESNLKFLNEAAKKLHFEFGIDGQFLIFRERTYKAKPEYVFTYRGRTITSDILEFKPKLNTFAVPAAYQAVYIDPATGRQRPVDGSAEKTNRVLLGGDGGVSGLATGGSGAAVGSDVRKEVSLTKQKVNPVTVQAKPNGGVQVKEVPKKKPSRTRKQQAQKCQTEALFKSHEDALLDADLGLIGQPKLKDKQIIQLNELGPAFSGLWYTYDVTNKIGNGFFSKVKLERNTLGFSKISGVVKGAGKPTAKPTPAPGRAKVVKQAQNKKEKARSRRR